MYIFLLCDNINIADLLTQVKEISHSTYKKKFTNMGLDNQALISLLSDR